MSLRPANPCGKAGMAYPEVKPLFCRVPLPKFPCHALAFSASTPVLVLGTNIWDRTGFLFMGPGNQRNPLAGAIRELICFSS